MEDGASSSNISNRKYDGKTTLQSVGEVDARKASNLKVGDIIMYNYGYNKDNRNSHVGRRC